MNSKSALGAVFLTAAIGWSGFTIADKVFRSLPVYSSEMEEALVPAVADAKAPANSTRPRAPRVTVPDVIVPEPSLATVDRLPDPTPVVRGAEVAAAPTTAPRALPAVPSLEPIAAGPAEVKKTGEVEFEETDLLAAVQQGVVQATLRGNGQIGRAHV